MDENSLNRLIADYEAAHKNIAISYGGDGTLLDVARKFGGKKAIIPIRNYGRCLEHTDLPLELLTGIKSDGTKVDYQPKMTIHPQIMYSYRNRDGQLLSNNALAEITMKNADVTSCLRFDVYVNSKLYMENVMCDGIIASTALGSHGYWKSVTRTLFVDGIGLAFIAPTYGINNVLLRNQDKVFIKFTRHFDVVVTADKDMTTVTVKPGDLFTIEDACKNVSLIGYGMFCCNECRKNRNSTIIVNDQYFA